MGDCIYVADDGVELDRFRRVGHPVVRVMPSEQWMDATEAGRILAEGHFLNTTTGVWFYEADLLYEPARLRERLLALADYVGTDAFQREYETARARSRTEAATVWRPKE